VETALQTTMTTVIIRAQMSEPENSGPETKGPNGMKWKKEKP